METRLKKMEEYKKKKSERKNRMDRGEVEVILQ